jgi:hypothetical protein
MAAVNPEERYLPLLGAEGRGTERKTLPRFQGVHKKLFNCSAQTGCSIHAAASAAEPFPLIHYYIFCRKGF